MAVDNTVTPSDDKATINLRLTRLYDRCNLARENDGSDLEIKK